MPRAAAPYTVADVHRGRQRERGHTGPAQRRGLQRSPGGIYHGYLAGELACRTGRDEVVIAHCATGRTLAVVQVVPASLKPPPLTETEPMPKGTMPVLESFKVSSALLPVGTHPKLSADGLSVGAGAGAAAWTTPTGVQPAAP